jgi:hypothetical protein
MHRPRFNLWTVTTFVALVGCVQDSAAAGNPVGGGNPSTGPIIPWQVGNTWTYRVTNGSATDTKVTSIQAAEPIGGDGPHRADLAFKVVTLKSDGTDQTISWQAPFGEKVLRYREQSFHSHGGGLELETYWDPYKLHIDGSAEHAVAEASWTESYLETKLPEGAAPSSMPQQDSWAVDQADANVTVPAGTFQHAIIYRKGGTGDVKTYWYVRGIGKIKEVGGQTEELASYQVSP